MVKMRSLTKAVSSVIFAGAVAGTFLCANVAYSAQDGKGGIQQGQGQGGQGSGVKGGSGKGGAGGSKSLEDRVLRDKGPGSDSDAPAWAGPNPTAENPHKQGGGKPGGAGTKKGDDFGDLWVILRDANGVPILFIDANANGTYDAGEECTAEGCYAQPYYVDADNNIVLIPLDAEGSPVADGLTVEVEFGRLNIGRSPTKVTDKSLTAALDAILQTDAVLSLDAAGRIVITINGVSKTIDSPLENIALYAALLTDGSNLTGDLKTKYDAAVLLLATLPGDQMDLAASLLAGGADKTGLISVDTVAYLNIMYDIAAMTPTDYVDYSSFNYDRSSLYNVVITYNELNTDGSTTPVTGTILDLVFGGVNVTDPSGVDAFAQAADDALQVIEFIHEPIHDLQP
jgi:hypothetical protein